MSVCGSRFVVGGQAIPASPESQKGTAVMIESLAALKRALVPGTVVTLVSREHPPLMSGYDPTGIARRVVQVKSRAVAFESVRPDTDKPSWLYWPKAEDVSFALEESGSAQLFTVNGMTYRIEMSQGARPV